MSDVEQDILTEISDDDLSKLLKMYEKHKDWIPHVYSIILTGIDWRKKKNEKYTIFLSPNGCWKEDGTFFVLLKVDVKSSYSKLKSTYLNTIIFSTTLSIYFVFPWTTAVRTFMKEY